RAGEHAVGLAAGAGAVARTEVALLARLHHLVATRRRGALARLADAAGDGRRRAGRAVCHCRAGGALVRGRRARPVGGAGIRRVAVVNRGVVAATREMAVALAAGAGPVGRAGVALLARLDDAVATFRADALAHRTTDYPGPARASGGDGRAVLAGVLRGAHRGRQTRSVVAVGERHARRARAGAVLLASHARAVLGAMVALLAGVLDAVAAHAHVGAVAAAVVGAVRHAGVVARARGGRVAAPAAGGRAHDPEADDRGRAQSPEAIGAHRMSPGTEPTRVSRRRVVS